MPLFELATDLWSVLANEIVVSTTRSKDITDFLVVQTGEKDATTEERLLQAV